MHSRARDMGKMARRFAPVSGMREKFKNFLKNLPKLFAFLFAFFV